MPRLIDLKTVEDILSEIEPESSVEKAKWHQVKDRINERSATVTDSGHDINAMAVAYIVESITVDNILDQIRKGTLSKWLSSTRCALLGYLNLIAGETKEV